MRSHVVEEFLLRTGAVDACATCTSVVDGRERRVAFVVPRAQVPYSPADLRRQADGALGADQAPHAFVEVRRIPLTPDGAVDEARLLTLEAVDEALAAEWERELREQPGVTDAAVVVEEWPVATPVWHLSDLVTDWDGATVEASPSSVAADDATRTGSDTRPPAYAAGTTVEIPADAPRTLAEGLIRTATGRGAKGIHLVRADGGETWLSYADLLASAQRALAGLRHVGLKAGDSVVLQISAIDEHLPTFWACLLGGIKPVTVAVPSAYDGKNAVVRKMFNAWQLLGRPRIIASRELVAPLEALRSDLDMAGLVVVPADELRQHAATADYHPSTPDDVAFYQLSSGSTGVSKCIQIRHGGVVHHIHAAQQYLGLSSSDVTLNWLPLDHVVPLLMYHIKDLYLGIEAVQVPGSVVLGDPLRWLDALERYKVTHSWAPNFGFKMVADALATASDRRWDLSSIKGLVNAGEQVTLPVVRDFLDRVAPFGVTPRAMQPAYGMAEVCTAMNYEGAFAFDRSIHRLAKSSLHGALRHAVDDEASVVFVSCGDIVGVETRIADKANAVLPEGTIGRIQIRGPVVTPGYLNNPAANEEADGGDGWFNTGDLGFLWDGRLTITGREKELIIVNGANFYCYEIEDIASGIPGVLPTFAAACGVDDPTTGTEALAFFFVHDPASGTDVTDVVKRVRTDIGAQAGLSPAFVIPVARDEFPKTTSGKIQRGQLKQGLLDGRFRQTLKELDVRLENANTLPAWFHRPVWRRKQAGASVGVSPAAGVRVVFADVGGVGTLIAQTWRAQGTPTVLVTPGAALKHVQPDSFEMNPASDAEHKAVVARIVEVHGSIGVLVHAWSRDDVSAAGVAGTDAALSRGLLSVLSTVQALAGVQADVRTTVVVATSHAAHVVEGDKVIPAHAPLSALVKTAQAELGWLDCHLVDLDQDDPQRVAGAVMGECERVSTDSETAYRSGVRHVPVVERMDLTQAALAPPAFRRHGVYLLTGGLGGVGTEIAKFLLARFEARLIIIGRSVVTESAADARALALRDLRRLRGDVLYADADVADLERLREIVGQARSRWGVGLDGVVHMAGVFAEHQLLEETRDTFAAALRPKVQGTLALHALVADQPGALFVMFSSVYGLVGGYGSGAYACSNAFLDGFVEWQRRESPVRAVSVAWSLWNETGMSRGYSNESAAHARGFRLLPRRQAVQSLAAVLQRDVARVVVGLDENGRGVRALLDVPQVEAQRLVAYCVAATDVDVRALATTLPVTDTFGRPTTCVMRRVETLPRAADGGVDRRALASGGPGERAEREAPRSDIEQIVASVWQEALKQEGLGVHDNFFELGGTSFLAGQIAGRLRTRLQTDVVITQMFQFPTIATQAAFLSGSNEPSAAVATSQSRGSSRRESALRVRRGLPRPLRTT